MSDSNTVFSTVDTPGAVPDKTNAEKAYRLLREDIVAGTLLPGQKLKVEMLRQRYGLGAGPIREALSRLSSNHLVYLEGQRGFEVAPISIEDANDVGNIRKVLEVQALQSSIVSGDEDWEVAVITTFHRLERIERRLDQGIGELGEWELRNQLFHQALVSGCNSPWVLRLRALIFDQHERYRRLSRVKSVTTRDISVEHKSLFDAALDRDVEKAVAVIETHIQRTTDTVMAELSF